MSIQEGWFKRRHVGYLIDYLAVAFHGAYHPIAAGTEIGSTSGQKRAGRVTLLSLYLAYGNAETLT